MHPPSRCGLNPSCFLLCDDLSFMCCGCSLIALCLEMVHLTRPIKHASSRGGIAGRQQHRRASIAGTGKRHRDTRGITIWWLHSTGGASIAPQRFHFQLTRHSTKHTHASSTRSNTAMAGRQPSQAQGKYRASGIVTLRHRRRSASQYRWSLPTGRDWREWGGERWALR